MANLPSSGTLTLAQIQSHFGGSNPVSLSEYYRGGPYVPSSKRFVIADIDDAFSTGGSDDTFWNRTNGDVWWEGDLINSGLSPGVTSFTFGIGANTIRVRRGAFQFEFLGQELYAVDWYEYRDGDINTNIPTSGRIDMNDFYGADNGA